ncbi:DMT family transporter [Halogranum amylolyticum]|nr:DMT family transporter [Halogranum amylolyticum]
MDGLLAGVDGAFSASPAVYLLALVPALLWGFSPVLSKRGMSAGGDAVQAALVVVVVDSALYWLLLLARQGLDLFTALSPTTLGVFVVAGAVGTALGRIAVFNGVDRVGASVNSAVISARPLFATALAVGFLGERVTPTTVLGIVVLVVGLVLLTVAKGGDLGGWKPRDLLFPLGAAAFFAAGNVLRRFGLTTSPTTALEAVTLNETAALVALAAYALTRHRDAVFGSPRRSYLYFAGSGLLTAVALLSLFAAFSLPEGDVAIVDPLAATAPLFTTVFSYFLLSDLETVTRGVVAGAVAVVVGAALVTLGPGAAVA